MRNLVLLGCIWMMACLLHGQSTPFQISLEPLEIKGMPGLQSFAFGQYDGEWLLLGGRVEGLHRRQPFAAFDSLGNNYRLTVVNPNTQEVWMRDLASLPTDLREHLSATNPEFMQVGNRLYIVGGYGYSPSLGDHKTYDHLTSIDLPGLMLAIKQGGNMAPYFQQISNPRLAVTGGQLERIGETFYLVGGQNFGGRYNPNGPDFGPGFFQRYNHELISFELAENDKLDAIFHFQAPLDTVNLHRRDFNMAPQIMPNGQAGLLAFSGVFQYKADIPYLNIVEITASGYRVVPDFQQHYQQYHCAKLPLYDAKTGEMHTVFWGGIGEYYDSAGVHSIDYNVPFTKTISRVTRRADGNYQEFRLPVEMPDYLGAGAEFIPLQSLPKYENGVLKLEELPLEKTLLGYIVGGIQSDDDNVFWSSEGEKSRASTQIYRVYLHQSDDAPADFENVHSNSPLQMEVLTDPFKGQLTLDFMHPVSGKVSLVLTDANGKTILKKNYSNLPIGKQHLILKCKAFKKTGRFLLNLTTPADSLKLRLVVEL